MIKLIKQLTQSFTKMISPKGLAIDLGTANTVVYVQGKGIVLNEPSIVAIIYDSGVEVPYLFGARAKLMDGKTPKKIIVKHPLRDGVIADFKVAQEMISYFIRSAQKRRRFFKPNIIICVPLESTPVERRAIQEAAEDCGAKEVMLIEEPMAAAIGALLPVTEATGSMVVDIGGGTTEIAIISLGGIVHGRSIKVGGNVIDTNIIQYVKQKYNLLIGENTAEKIKKEIGVAHLKPNDPNKDTAVSGRDLISGIPKEITVTQEDVVNALQEPINRIVEAIKLTLETSPPELSSDIVDRGIVLTGGGALLGNIDYVISKATHLPVFIANDPLLCVAQGIGKVLEDCHNHEHVLFRQV